jgi:predicted nucleotidyltransferase
MEKLNVKTFSELLRGSRLLEKYSLKKISLFGSFVRGKDFNDIDILVDEAPNYDALIEFREELESMTKKKVDIVIKKFANPIVLYRARKDLIDVTAN